jgi:hypothetical protein
MGTVDFDIVFFASNDAAVSQPDESSTKGDRNFINVG